jgi:hypothetical protein
VAICIAGCAAQAADAAGQQAGGAPFELAPRLAADVAGVLGGLPPGEAGSGPVGQRGEEAAVTSGELGGGADPAARAAAEEQAAAAASAEAEGPAAALPAPDGGLKKGGVERGRSE